MGTKQRLTPFEAYFLEFYGPNGLYPMEGLTLRDIRCGVLMRGKHFDGDSIDREAIRDAILCAKGRMGGAFGINSNAKVE